ncbi:MAG: hypothetical protein ABIV94_04820 [Acidimicrobiales bacterium]
MHDTRGRTDDAPTGRSPGGRNRRRLARSAVAAGLLVAVLASCGGGNPVADDRLYAARSKLDATVRSSVFESTYLAMQTEMAARGGATDLSPASALVYSLLTSSTAATAKAVDPATTPVEEVRGLEDYNDITQKAVESDVLKPTYEAALLRFQAIIGTNSSS